MIDNLSGGKQSFKREVCLGMNGLPQVLPELEE